MAQSGSILMMVFREWKSLGGIFSNGVPLEAMVGRACDGYEMAWEIIDYVYR